MSKRKREDVLCRQCKRWRPCRCDAYIPATTRKRQPLTAAERDERIVAKAGPWMGRSWWSHHVPCVYPEINEERDLAASERVYEAAARILNRLRRGHR